MMTIAQVVLHATSIIKEVVTALADAQEHKITPDEAIAKMSAAGRMHDAPNARVDAAADEKFGPKKTAEEDGQ